MADRQQIKENIKNRSEKAKAAALAPTSNTALQMLRYVVVSLAAAAVDWLVFAACTWIFGETDRFLGIQFKFYFTTISSLLGGIVNYVMSKRWVFNQSKMSNRLMEFLFFTLIGGIGLVLNIVTLKIFADFIGMNARVAKIISIVVVFFSTFFIRKYCLFNDKKKD
ncbi:MAG: GtrA family protein [Paludibacteraceae bacterium]|nr:GtrA family protein [Paludibacteraceae bacterium]